MPLPNPLSWTLVTMMAIAPAVQAAEWWIEPSASLRAGYNDNIRLTATKHDPVWEVNLSPSARFGVAREKQGVTGEAGFAIRRFSGGSGRESSDILNREDYHFDLNAYKSSLKNSFGARMNYIQDSTLDSELDESGIVTEDRATRKRFTLAPSWTATINEKTTTQVSYQFDNIEYSEDPGIPDLVSYDYHNLSTLLIRQLTPRTRATLTAGYTSYQPNTNFNSDTLSLQAGLSTNFSETLVTSFLVGRRTTTSDAFIGSGFCIGADPGATFPTCAGGFPVPTGFVKGEIETSGVVYSASISKILETGQLSLALTRASQPNSNGELLDSTRLILTGEHRITKTLHSSLRIDFTENETIVNRVGFTPNQDNDTFFRVIPGLSWRWRYEWELSGEYQYAANEDAGSSKATRNALYLTLAYRPRKMSVSR